MLVAKTNDMALETPFFMISTVIQDFWPIPILSNDEVSWSELVPEIRPRMPVRRLFWSKKIAVRMYTARSG